MSVHRTPDERFAGLVGYDFEPHWLEHDALRMHYVEEGAGEPVLCLHGEPTWSFLYRKMIPPLARAARVVAPDYVGFGRSDKPTEIGWYTFDRHFASILRLVEALDLRSLTVVVQDWGGPIGLRLAVEQPDRVERLVIMNTGVGGGRAPSDTWLRFREVVRDRGGDLDISRLVAAGCARGLAPEAAAGYEAPFPTGESKAGALAFPELVPTEPDHPNTKPTSRGEKCPRKLAQADARPLRRLRPDLPATGRRADRRPHPRRPSRRDDRERRPLRPGRRRRRGSRAHRALPWHRG